MGKWERKVEAFKRIIFILSRERGFAFTDEMMLRVGIFYDSYSLSLSSYVFLSWSFQEVEINKVVAVPLPLSSKLVLTD